MYTTVEKVKVITGYEVTLEVIERAQYIIETVTGRTEAEVDNASDLMLLSNATSFQAAYMSNNYEKVYEQVALLSKTATDSEIVMNPGMDAPFIAPLAVIAMRRLSWARGRSIKVGPTYGPHPRPSWEMD